MRVVKKFIEDLPVGVEVDFLTIGRKGQDAVRRLNQNIVATFTDLAIYPTVLDIRPIAKIAIEDFVAGKYRSVYLAFTDYISTLVQKPNISQLLPIARIEGLGEIDNSIKTEKSAGQKLNISQQEYLFEPSPQAVLDVMLPRLVEAQVYQAILETSAAEHSARMLAMRNATEAATEMIDSLTLSYNRARQAGITAEIAEISSGKAALEK
jgi:F-type H+-transporting ATPase subunit gamma